MCDFATPDNTMGMGNPAFPSPDNTELGSELIGFNIPLLYRHKKLKKKKRMKSIKECLNEGLTKTQTEIVGNMFIKMFSHTNITKDQLVMMFTNIDDMSVIKNISDYINKTDTKNAMAYVATADEFLKKENYKRIIDNLSQYFEKYIVI